MADKIVIYLSVALELGNAFPCSMLVNSGEFIPHRACSGGWFSITGCDLDAVKAKAIEWLSRDAYKTDPYRSDKKNREYHMYIREGLNRLLGTSFNTDEWEIIYTYLGNACNRDRTLRFIENGYSIKKLLDDVNNAKPVMAIPMKGE